MTDDTANGFLQRLAEHQAGEQSTPPAAPPVNGAPLGGEPHPAYIAAALQDEIQQLARTPKGKSGLPGEGRNHALNVTALKLARLPIDRNHLTRDLIDACHANSLIHDDGERSVRATINSAYKKADLDGPRIIPEPATPATVTEVTADQLGAVSTEGELTQAETQDLHQIRVARNAYELRVADEARQLYASQQAELLGQHAPLPQSLTAFLSVPDTDAVYRITDLLPVGGRALLAAQYKAGKTSMIANLLRSLADGDHFLGRYHTTPTQQVTVLDTELDERMLRRWLRNQNIRHTDNIHVVSLRGHLTTFNILNDRNRANWATRLTGSDILILDCLRPCIDALGLSEDKDAGKFLVAFDALLAETGAQEAIVVHHMGHTEERSRGDSRLLDWPDVLWKIVRDRDDDGATNETGDRYFSAMGRDVNISEQLLDYTPENGALMVCGGSRTDKKARGTFDDIVEILADPANSEGLSRNKLVAKLQALGNGRNTARHALRMAIEQGLVITISGPRGSDVHILNPSEMR